MTSLWEDFLLRFFSLSGAADPDRSPASYLRNVSFICSCGTKGKRRNIVNTRKRLKKTTLSFALSATGERSEVTYFYFLNVKLSSEWWWEGRQPPDRLKQSIDVR